MPSPRITLIRGSYHEVDGLGVEGRGGVGLDEDGAGFFGSFDVVAPVRLADLKTVLLRAPHWLGGDEAHLALTATPADRVHEDSQRLDISFAATEGELFLDVSLQNAFDHEPTDAEVFEPIATFLTQRNLEVAGPVEYWQAVDDDLWLPVLRLRWRQRGRTVSDAVDLSTELLAHANLLSTGVVDLDSALEAIRAGQTKLLVGMYENQWLEAKSAPYRLDDDPSQFELAKDVAAFANSGGGIIVIGARTKRRVEGEEIVDINECRLADVSRRRWLNALQRLVVPMPSNVDVETIAGGIAGLGVAVVRVPDQPRESRPFLVGGAPRNGKIVRDFFTWPIRRNGDTVYPRVETVYEQLRAGAAALAGGTGAGSSDVLS